MYQHIALLYCFTFHYLFYHDIYYINIFLNINYTNLCISQTSVDQWNSGKLHVFLYIQASEVKGLWWVL